jgi:hypothetical protein
MPVSCLRLWWTRLFLFVAPNHAHVTARTRPAHCVRTYVAAMRITLSGVSYVSNAHPHSRYASGEGNTGCGECPVLPVGWVCSQGSTTPEGTLCGAGKYADAAKGCAPCDNNECAFSVRVTFNATLTFVPSVDACLPEAAVTPLLLEQHIRSAAAYTPANLEVVVLVGEPQCPSPSSPVTQFLNFTVTLKGLPYPMAANTLVRVLGAA